MEMISQDNQMRNWRRALHQVPEFGFNTKKTAAFVIEKLRSFGIDNITDGVGGTGVVATLKRGTSKKAIAIRADMDALMIEEKTNLEYRSTIPGIMHACGHDGHTATLLGVAETLAKGDHFDGIIHFIFQPAEEWGKGAQAMIDDGLMQKFPFEEIWGFHNMPGMPIGNFETRSGPIMSAEDNFEIQLIGIGGHASKPQAGKETMLPACSLITELQTIVSRRIDPTDIAVVSVTELITDGSRNILPGLSRILGDARSFRSEVSLAIENEMTVITAGIASTYGLDYSISYTREFIPLINDDKLAEHAIKVGQKVFGTERAKLADRPVTGSEDFARFLNHVPGCYVFFGNGENSAPLHNSSYDFNDDALEHGVNYLVNLAQNRLKP
jgi:amidohydrolase|tara:strand:+ start:26 stop:1177 length:1152 start_codon:yes stop_codon:yes gene_type:complete